MALHLAHNTAMKSTTVTDWLQGIFPGLVTSLIIQHHFLSPLLYTKKFVSSFDVFCWGIPAAEGTMGYNWLQSKLLAGGRDNELRNSDIMIHHLPKIVSSLIF